MKHSHGLTRKRRRHIIQSRKCERRYASRSPVIFLLALTGGLTSAAR